MIQNHGTNMAFVQLKSIYYEAGTQRAQNVQPKGQTMEWWSTVKKKTKSKINPKIYIGIHIFLYDGMAFFILSMLFDFKDNFFFIEN